MVAFQNDGNITLTPLGELKASLQQGLWNQNTPTFNNLVPTKEDLKTGWVVPAGASWLKRYLPYESVTH